MAAELLRVAGLHAYYGESHVLHGVECHVNSGEVVTLLGRNGAGRTTTLKALLGLVGSRSGSVMINGREAIACLRQHKTRIQLVLLDVMMPSVNGWDVLNEIQRDPALAIVQLSSYDRFHSKSSMRFVTCM